MAGEITISSNGRFLLRNGAPFRLQGDTAWEVVNELDMTEIDTYLTDRLARGFNSMIVQVTNPVKYTAGSYAPGAKGVSGALPWLLNTSGGTWTGVFANHDAAFSSPNSIYWDWVDDVIERFADFGMVMIVDFMYMGFNQGAADGWWQCVGNSINTQAVCFAFGQYLGNRWKNHPNLILDLGTDMFPVSGSESSARMLKILDGMQDVGCTQLTSAHYQRSSDAQDYSDYNARVTFNSIYPGRGGSGYAPDIARSRRAYARTPAMPCAPVETKYEGEFSFTRLQIRQLGWWGYLSSIAGYFFGNSPIWEFDTGWPAAMSAPGSLDMQRMGAFLDSRPWWTLVPNGLGSIGTLITAGGGTVQTLGTVGGPDGDDGYDYVAAAANPEGTLLVAYVPDAHTGTVTVDMTKMSAPCLARWLDPTVNGAAAYTTIGTFANTSTRAFTPPAARGDGTKDIVLVLEVVARAPAIFSFWMGQ